MTIYWRVEELAAQRGWGARRLAEEAGLDQKTVRKILAGRATRVDLNTIARCRWRSMWDRGRSGSSAPTRPEPGRGRRAPRGRHGPVSWTTCSPGNGRSRSIPPWSGRSGRLERYYLDTNFIYAHLRQGAAQPLDQSRPGGRKC